MDLISHGCCLCCGYGGIGGSSLILLLEADSTKMTSKRSRSIVYPKLKSQAIVVILRYAATAYAVQTAITHVYIYNWLYLTLMVGVWLQ